MTRVALLLFGSLAVVVIVIAFVSGIRAYRAIDRYLDGLPDPVAPVAWCGTCGDTFPLDEAEWHFVSQHEDSSA